MEKYQCVDAVVNNFRPSQISLLEGGDDSIQNAIKQPSNQKNIARILELLNTNDDVNFHVKLFSVLSANILFNDDANFEIICKYSAVYDKINNVLVTGLVRKAVHAFNFLSVLLNVDAKDNGLTKRRTLALYAKNMTRTSGCLATMADMFSNNCMMYHDTWKALCLCLAAACSGNELNQTYCSHIIPVCIQRCNQTNIDIFLVLQSLLLNHDKNMELFLNSNGISIFTRELLHYDKCLQLLVTVVQFPTAPALLLCQVKVLKELQDFLHRYGPRSQIGQKAMIILSHIELRAKELRSKVNQESHENTLNEMKSKEGSNNLTPTNEYNRNNELDDTATLMQNIVKEVFNIKHDAMKSFKKPEPKTHANSFIWNTNTIKSRENKNNREVHITNIPNRTKNLIDLQRKQKIRCYNDSERTFSMLQNNTNSFSKHNSYEKTLEKSKILSEKGTDTFREINKTQKCGITRNFSPHLYTTCKEKLTFIDPKEFKPILSSTPIIHNTHNLTGTRNSIHESRFQTQSQRRKQGPMKAVKRRLKKIPQKKEKIVSNKSFSSKFFSAINETCTTLVKTVASIFKKNEPLDSFKERIQTYEHVSRADNCSYSFLEYMQKRDLILNNSKKFKNTRNDCTYLSLRTDLCETCDTYALRKKLKRNEHLKQTVRKLKVGINLFGCDFKKISRTMWPREPYMTHTVLNNLYRKLLLK